MSARFWLFSMASVGAALVGGMSLGLYATTSPRAAVAEYDAGSSVVEEAHMASLDMMALNGPQEVKCTGCGPTLAERQFHAASASWDGYDDATVRDYDGQEPGQPEDLLADLDRPMHSPAHQLPEEIERFANGDGLAPYPVRVAQGVATPHGQLQPSIAVP